MNNEQKIGVIATEMMVAPAPLMQSRIDIAKKFGLDLDNYIEEEYQYILKRIAFRESDDPFSLLTPEELETYSKKYYRDERIKMSPADYEIHMKRVVDAGIVADEWMAKQDAERPTTSPDKRSFEEVFYGDQ
jgi:hypothetical protein